MTVQDLYIYPVKSLGGIKTEKARALQRGFEFDRRWMLIDDTGKFISQRTEFQLALLRTRITENGVQISHKSKDTSISIPFGFGSAGPVDVSIWDDRLQAVHVSEEADEWFSEMTGKSCRFVFLPENGQRPVDPRYAANEEQVSFADAFPYLLISQASLNDVNSRMNEPVPMNRFRPNIVISNTEAFEEDTWNEIRIGEVRFKVAKPCARCVLTTVDQETAIKGKEPLATLARYRTINNKVMFGQNLIALNEGFITAGDSLEVISSK